MEIQFCQIDSFEIKVVGEFGMKEWKAGLHLGRPSHAQSIGALSNCAPAKSKLQLLCPDFQRTKPPGFVTYYKTAKGLRIWDSVPCHYVGGCKWVELLLPTVLPTDVWDVWQFSTNNGVGTIRQWQGRSWDHVSGYGPSCAHICTASLRPSSSATHAETCEHRSCYR